MTILKLFGDNFEFTLPLTFPFPPKKLHHLQVTVLAVLFTSFYVLSMQIKLRL